MSTTADASPYRREPVLPSSGDHALPVGQKAFVAHREIAEPRQDDIAVEAHGNTLLQQAIRLAAERNFIFLVRTCADHRELIGGRRNRTVRPRCRQVCAWQ